MVNWTLFLIVKYLLSISSVMSLYSITLSFKREFERTKLSEHKENAQFYEPIIHQKMTFFSKK